MYNVVDKSRRLETRCVYLSGTYAVGFIWILMVTFALICVFGVDLHTSSLTNGGWVAIGCTIGVTVTLYVIAVVFLIYCWYRRKLFSPRLRRRRQALSRGCSDGGNNWHSSYPKVSLQKHSSAFQQLVNLDTLLPLLYQKGLLTSSEFQEWVKSKPISRNLQILYMLTILDQKGHQGVHYIVEALRQEREHIGHKELADILTKDYDSDATYGSHFNGYQYNRSHSS